MQVMGEGMPATHRTFLFRAIKLASPYWVLTQHGAVPPQYPRLRQALHKRPGDGAAHSLALTRAHTLMRMIDATRADDAHHRHVVPSRRRRRQLAAAEARGPVPPLRRLLQHGATCCNTVQRDAPD